MFKQMAKGLGGVVFGPESGAEPEDRAVENLLQRVVDGILAEDRREALEQLRDLLPDSPKARSALGAMGFPILCEVVREERKDTDVLRAALECLANAFTTSAVGGAVSQEQQQVADVNAELFSRDKANVPLLLGLLEEPPVGVDDFGMRYHALQILTALSSSLHRLQEAVLAHPMGVVRLMDCLSGREVIRNEALLLLIVLAHGNADIQKIVAFEGGFERLLSIIREEGAADGGIVVQDCLQLTHGLLRRNPSNQRMFRELGMVGNLPALLRLRQRGGSIARQQASNLICVLETLRVLIASENGVISADALTNDAGSLANQEAILKSGVLDILIAAPLGDGAISSAAVRTKALDCLAALLTVSATARDKLAGAVVTARGARVSALHALLQSALHRQSPQERRAAEAAIEAFCFGNPAGRALLASTLASGSGASFGSELLAALIAPSRGDSLTTAGRAARMLSYILVDTPQAQAQALAACAPAQPGSGASQQPLLAAVAAQLAAASEAAAPVAALLGSLLAAWCAGCAPAARALAEAPERLKAVSAVAVGRDGHANALPSGLAAAALGAAFLALDDERQQGAQSPALSAIAGSIATDIGGERLLARVRELQGSQAFQTAAAGPQPLPPITRLLLASALAVDTGMMLNILDGGQQRQNGAAQPPPDVEPLLGRHLCPLLASAAAALEQRLLPALAASQAHPSQASPPPQSGAPPQLRPPPQFQPPRPPSFRPAPAAGLAGDVQLREAQSTIERLQWELEQLRVSGAAGAGRAEEAAAAQAAQTAAEAEALRQQLQQSSAERDSLQTELQRAAQEAQAATAAAAKAEADVEDLANAFQGLESHAAQLEGQLREAQSQPAQSPAGQDDAQQRIEEAVEAANAEAEENLNDLLACLGQEERKTERLSERLRELGEDVDTLLEGITVEEDEDEEEDEPDMS